MSLRNINYDNSAVKRENWEKLDSNSNSNSYGSTKHSTLLHT